MKSNNIIAIIVLLLIVGIGAFFGGTKYQQRKTVSQFSQRTGFTGAVGQGMARGTGTGTGAAGTNRQAGFRQTVGDIINADDKSITVKLTDGSSKIVLLADTTTIGQFTPATKTDLKIGTKVAVVGDQNTDGSVTGRNIQINPSVPSVSPTVTPTK